MIGRNGERGSGISALAARHDDDDSISDIVGYPELNSIYAYNSVSYGKITFLHNSQWITFATFRLFALIC